MTLQDEKRSHSRIKKNGPLLYVHAVLTECTFSLMHSGRVDGFYLLTLKGKRWICVICDTTPNCTKLTLLSALWTSYPEGLICAEKRNLCARLCMSSRCACSAQGWFLRALRSECVCPPLCGLQYAAVTCPPAPQESFVLRIWLSLNSTNSLKDGWKDVKRKEPGCWQVLHLLFKWGPCCGGAR